jgi:SpoVK/Ycf46/Vps4 family AAA+-type ATPase
MLSYFLNWLSSRNVSASAERRTFVVVTLNRTTGVPPELLRPGRFDKVWATDLPDEEGRLEILRIHLAKRGIDPGQYGKALDSIVSVTQDFSGAEIEELVRSARCNAYHDRYRKWEQQGKPDGGLTTEICQPTVDELAQARLEITPLAKLAEDEVKATRVYCRQKGAAPVNGKAIQVEVAAAPPARQSRRIAQAPAAG